ncbi:MAG: peptidase associated/transthyretin-like domain-containing protein [Rudaea sp.]
MIRPILILVLCAPAAAFAATDACRVSGTAYDFGGHPLHAAVVRLTDMQSQRTELLATDAHADYVFADLAPGARYRLDLLSTPTVVTGTHVPTRSVVGRSSAFACAAGQGARADVHAQVD